MSEIQVAIKFPISNRPRAKATSHVSIDTSFPEKEANLLGEIEAFNKHLFRPNTYLHKWWARRSGSTFRYILKQLVPDSEKRDYYSPGGLEGLTILDPMMGGGTTLHEAIRMGANVIGYDIDPIPVLQAKASLPSVPLSEKQKVYDYFFRELTERIAHHFKTECPNCKRNSEIQYTLYGLRKTCDNGEFVVVDSNVLREESRGTSIRLEDFYPGMSIPIGTERISIIDRAKAKDLGINGKSSELTSIKFVDRYVPLIILGHCRDHGTFFKPLDDQDFKVLKAARKWAQKNICLDQEQFLIPDGPKSDDLISRNISSYDQLFFSRQLCYIIEAQSVFKNIPEDHLVWLALLVSTSLEFNSALCGYKGAEKRRPGAIRHVFSHHAYSFPYTSLENNPVFSGKTSGTLNSLFQKRIYSAGKWAQAPVERHFDGESWKKKLIENEIDMGTAALSIEDFDNSQRRFLVAQNDSTRIPLPAHSVDFIVTDPPYFDSVQYSDLSHFFRCWLRQFLPNGAEWQYMVSRSAVAEHSEKQAKFGSVIGDIWLECSRLLKQPHGRLVFTYHHWRPSAWAQLNIALKRANFELMNCYVVHSENPISVHIRQLNALKHDTILVLRPRRASESIVWQKPSLIARPDSYSFCRSCGEMTGWILSNDLDDDRIKKEWSSFIEEQNAKISV